jgi:hypothetical protein
MFMTMHAVTVFYLECVDPLLSLYFPFHLLNKDTLSHGSASGSHCNPRFLGVWDWEDHSSRQAWVGSLQNPISTSSWALWYGPFILATWKAEIRMIVVLGQTGQKVCKTPSQHKKSWLWWWACHPSNGGKLKIGR